MLRRDEFDIAQCEPGCLRHRSNALVLVAVDDQHPGIRPPLFDGAEYSQRFLEQIPGAIEPTYPNVKGRFGLLAGG